MRTTLEEITAYPLTWPNGKPRTLNTKRESSRFKTTLDRARQEILGEIVRLGGKRPIISTNQKLRQDGFPYGRMREPDDTGVAVYFTFKEKPMVFACDRYRWMGDNLHAVALTIEALRGISRWGTGDMMQQAFTGFTALPAGKSENVERTWWEVLGFAGPETKLEDAKTKRNELARKFHPDIGTEPNGPLMAAVNEAYRQAEVVLGAS